ncbi:hypothetical protein TNIN_286331 [Trichonephila inaurata madagascariensis]|uniref:Uncharacterized protein n=1 Tax=Trichonephila inaurata madagascariensis TaxID=2747483 RepID=A0A8X6XKX8_9ARAC|nr:hypothetical protein TNIN_286331 [Trichonephila inaurata madagascariensis]
MVGAIVRMFKELRQVLEIYLNYEELLTTYVIVSQIQCWALFTYIHEDQMLLPLSPTMFIHRNINCETTDLDQADPSSLVKHNKYLQELREDLRQGLERISCSSGHRGTKEMML